MIPLKINKPFMYPPSKLTANRAKWIQNASDFEVCPHRITCGLRDVCWHDVPRVFTGVKAGGGCRVGPGRDQLQDGPRTDRYFNSVIYVTHMSGRKSMGFKLEVISPLQMDLFWASTFQTCTKLGPLCTMGCDPKPPCSP